jgi:Xaa-Pro aminopeptidase
MSLDAACRDAMIAAGLKSGELHPHGLGHHVALSIRDPGAMVFRPGMVITIEPGAACEESLGIESKISTSSPETGAECLSRMIPKTVAEIEALVGAAWRK